MTNLLWLSRNWNIWNICELAVSILRTNSLHWWIGFLFHYPKQESDSKEDFWTSNSLNSEPSFIFTGDETQTADLQSGLLCKSWGVVGCGWGWGWTGCCKVREVESSSSCEGREGREGEGGDGIAILRTWLTLPGYWEEIFMFTLTPLYSNLASSLLQIYNQKYFQMFREGELKPGTRWHWDSLISDWVTTPLDHRGPHVSSIWYHNTRPLEPPPTSQTVCRHQRLNLIKHLKSSPE